MATPASGQIKLTDLAQEFGGVTPHAMSEYYNVAAGVPASGIIALSNFYNKVATAAVFNYTVRYQRSSQAFYNGRLYSLPRPLSFLGSYSQAGQSYSYDSQNFYIGHPLDKVIVDYSWEPFDYGPSCVYSSPYRGFGDLLIRVAANNPEIFDVAPFIIRGTGVQPDTEVQFTLALGYSMSYMQQDQSGSTNFGEPGKTGQTYICWMGQTVSGVSPIRGSGNNGSRFQITKPSFNGLNFPPSDNYSAGGFATANADPAPQNGTVNLKLTDGNWPASIIINSSARGSGSASTLALQYIRRMYNAQMYYGEEFSMYQSVCGSGTVDLLAPEGYIMTGIELTTNDWAFTGAGRLFFKQFDIDGHTVSWSAPSLAQNGNTDTGTGTDLINNPPWSGKTYTWQVMVGFKITVGAGNCARLTTEYGSTVNNLQAYYRTVTVTVA